jgi:hypothetical protein
MDSISSGASQTTTSPPCFTSPPKSAVTTAKTKRPLRDYERGATIL